MTPHHNVSAQSLSRNAKLLGITPKARLSIWKNLLLSVLLLWHTTNLKRSCKPYNEESTAVLDYYHTPMRLYQIKNSSCCEHCLDSYCNNEKSPVLVTLFFKNFLVRRILLGMALFFLRTFIVNALLIITETKEPSLMIIGRQFIQNQLPGPMWRQVFRHVILLCLHIGTHFVKGRGRD